LLDIIFLLFFVKIFNGRLPDGDQIGREMLENIVTQADGICSAFNIPFVGDDESYDIFDYQWKGAARRSSDDAPNTGTGTGNSFSGQIEDMSNREGGDANSGLHTATAKEGEMDPQAAADVVSTTSQVTPSSSSSSGTLKDDDAVDVDHLHGADAWSTEIEIESTESEILNADLSANAGGYWTPLKEEVSVTFDMLDIPSEPIAEGVSNVNMGDSKAEVKDAENDDDRDCNSSSSINEVTVADATGNGAPVSGPISHSKESSKTKKKSAGNSAAATTGANNKEYSKASASSVSRRKS
jgi:hypothetical protein